ncbi:MAG: sugar ABC transporter ATP-binding protein [Spirochaetales bacterium]|nr:MAG: sugar ABC transporter ATP-binding protein [Spirochaetales bacterium]
MSDTAQNDILLQLEGVNKWFGKIHCLQDINFSARRAETIGLVGDNGAGKSTLIKIISGYHHADSGSFFWEGKKVNVTCPRDARALGVETVYQDQALAPHLSIARNIFMGREPSGGGGFLKEKLMAEESLKALSNLGLNVKSSETPVMKLSGGERQGVAIARAIHFEAKLVILDEPTNALSVKEVHEVLEFVRQMKRKNLSVILISHNLHHVYSVADRIVVISHGKVLTDVKTSETSVDHLSDMIVSGTLGKVV